MSVYFVHRCTQTLTFSSSCIGSRRRAACSFYVLSSRSVNAFQPNQYTEAGLFLCSAPRVSRAYNLKARHFTSVKFISRTTSACGVRTSHFFPGLGLPTLILGVIHRSQAYAKDSDQLQAPFLRFELGSQIFHTNKCALTSVMDKRCIPFLFSFSFLPSRGRSWRGQIVTCDQFSEPVPNILIHSLYTDHRVGNKRFHILHSTFNAF